MPIAYPKLPKARPKCSLNSEMMLDIIITPDPVVIVDNESTDPGSSVDTAPGTSGTNTIITPAKAMSSSCPQDCTSWKATWDSYSHGL